MKSVSETDAAQRNEMKWSQLHLQLISAADDGGGSCVGVGGVAEITHRVP